MKRSQEGLGQDICPPCACIPKGPINWTWPLHSCHNSPLRHLLGPSCDPMATGIFEFLNLSWCLDQSVRADHKRHPDPYFQRSQVGSMKSTLYWAQSGYQHTLDRSPHRDPCPRPQVSAVYQRATVWYPLLGNSPGRSPLPSQTHCPSRSRIQLPTPPPGKLPLGIATVPSLSAVHPLSLWT